MKAKFKEGDIVEMKPNLDILFCVVGKGRIKAVHVAPCLVSYDVVFDCDTKYDVRIVEERYLRLVKRPFFGGLFKRNKTK